MKDKRFIHRISQLILAWSLVFSGGVCAAAMPTFLLGTWQVDNKNKYEHWESVNDKHYQGQAFKIDGGRKIVQEYLSIEEVKGDLIYRAQVLNQNQGQAIDFVLQSADDHSHVFENLAHDFPQQIAYEKITDDQLRVKVSAEQQKGFTHTMNRRDPPTTIPQWFIEDLKSNVGTWIADNKAFESETEPYDSYGMQWRWGLGHTSMTGRLYGMSDGKEMGDFWQFRQYWDNQNNRAVIEQFGFQSVVGIGQLKPLGTNQTESIQTFSMADGKSWQVKHVSKTGPHILETTSYNLDENKQWIKDRSYQWHKQPENSNALALGRFSVSLAVKDIKASHDFYQKLGFKALPGVGGIEKNWVILKNGEQKIGLFQGMFTDNTMTFNPTDARAIYHHLGKSGISSKVLYGINEPSGPASFSITDPDGNTILIDQHQ